MRKSLLFLLNTLLAAATLCVVSCGIDDVDAEDGAIQFELYDTEGTLIEGLQSMKFGATTAYTLKSAFVTYTEVTAPAGWKCSVIPSSRSCTVTAPGRLGSGSRSRRRHHDRDHLAGRTHDELHAQRSRPRREYFADLRRRGDDQKPHLLLRQEPRLPLLVRKHLFARSRSSRGLDDGNRPRKQPVDRHGADARQSESDADRCGQGDAAERPRHGRRIVVDQRRAFDQDARHPVRRADRPLRLRRTARHPLHDAVCRQVRHHGPRRLDGRTGYRRIDAQSHRTRRRGRNPRRHGHAGCGFGRGADRIVRNAALAERASPRATISWPSAKPSRRPRRSTSSCRRAR